MPDLGSRVELEEHETIIDLRDPMVATGLAEALNEVIALSERTGAAETKADLATQERLAAVGKVRRLTDDLEAEQAERHRLEVDNAALRSENLLRSEQLQDAHRELARTCDELAEILSARDRTIDWLRSELDGARRSVHTLEALVSRRSRRTYERLCGDDGPGR
jgi:predicted RNase H-like nuclease (RuvC/YqgF family)